MLMNDYFATAMKKSLLGDNKYFIITLCHHLSVIYN